MAETLTEIDALLAVAGIEPGADAQLLLGHVLGESRGRVQALAIMGTPISDEDRARVMRLADERASRVPLQHLTGRAAFRGIELEVGPGVFVPRPETESVAQFAIDALAAASVEAAAQDESGPIAVDLCTGSGAIALAIANEVPQASVWAVEKSPEAHAWASRNVDRLGEGRVQLVLGGEDGLDLVRVISKVALELVAPCGSLVLEHAEQQGEAIRSLLTADGWRTPATHQDLTLRDRTTTAVR